MKQKTTLNHLISELEKIESKVITTENVIYLAKSLLELEKDQLIDMANRYHKPLHEHGVRSMSGEKMFTHIYGN